VKNISSKMYEKKFIAELYSFLEGSLYIPETNQIQKCTTLWQIVKQVCNQIPPLYLLH
jgi:hypothetical protein